MPRKCPPNVDAFVNKATFAVGAIPSRQEAEYILKTAAGLVSEASTNDPRAIRRMKEIGEKAKKGHAPSKVAVEAFRTMAPLVPQFHLVGVASGGTVKVTARKPTAATPVRSATPVGSAAPVRSATPVTRPITNTLSAPSSSSTYIPSRSPTGPVVMNPSAPMGPATPMVPSAPSKPSAPTMSMSESAIPEPIGPVAPSGGSIYVPSRTPAGPIPMDGSAPMPTMSSDGYPTIPSSGGRVVSSRRVPQRGNTTQSTGNSANLKPDIKALVDYHLQHFPGEIDTYLNNIYSGNIDAYDQKQVDAAKAYVQEKKNPVHVTSHVPPSSSSGRAMVNPGTPSGSEGGSIYVPSRMADTTATPAPGMPGLPTPGVPNSPMPSYPGGGGGGGGVTSLPPEYYPPEYPEPSGEWWGERGEDIEQMYYDSLFERAEQYDEEREDW